MPCLVTSDGFFARLAMAFGADDPALSAMVKRKMVFDHVVVMFDQDQDI